MRGPVRWAFLCCVFAGIGVQAVPGAGRAKAEDRATASAPTRAWSIGATTWIYESPKRDARPLGSLRPGTSVALRDVKPQRGGGCAAKFYAVRPVGFVCADRSVTFDPSHPRLRQLAEAPRTPTILPFRYALSNGAPLYRRLPTPTESRDAERGLGPPGTHGELSWGNRGHERLARAGTIEPEGGVPEFLGKPSPELAAGPLVKKLAPLGTTVAYTRVFAHGGRTWLLTSDGLVVPADRVRPFRESVFAGMELEPGRELPIAYNRGEPKSKCVIDQHDHVRQVKRPWSTRSAVLLLPGADTRTIGGNEYLATRERTKKGLTVWVRAADATVISAREPPMAVKDGEQWLVVSITRGTLVAYEGRRPVFATLVSPGAGGVPVPGQNPVKMSTTPMGVFRITYKVRDTTMTPEKGEPKQFWLAEVPYTQYFSMPFALHTAYWHEDFGQLMSAGCINLSPRDGRWLFEWTKPHLPAEWSGAAASRELGPGTLLAVVR